MTREEFLDGVTRVARSGHEVTFRQAAILLHCERTRDAVDRQINSLATFFGFSKPVVSRAADRLVEFDLVRRSELPGDRRTCVLTITAAGVRFICEMMAEPAPRARRGRAA